MASVGQPKNVPGPLPTARRKCSKQTLNQYLDRWLEVCAKPRLRAKSFRDYEGLLRRYVRPHLGEKALATVSAFDIQTLY